MKNAVRASNGRSGHCKKRARESAPAFWLELVLVLGAVAVLIASGVRRVG